MKIAHVTCVFPPYRGGIGTDAFELSKAQALAGHEVTVFVPRYNNRSDFLKPEKVTIISMRPWLKFGNAALVPQIFFLVKNFDVVHLHLPFLGAAGFVALRRFFSKKIRLVVRYHMDLRANGWKKIIFSFFSHVIHPLVMRVADAVLVSSFDYAKHSDISGYFIKHPKRFFEIGFGVDEKRFFPASKNPTFWSRFGVGPLDTVILFVGGLDSAHAFKGLSVLLAALSLVRRSVRAHLVVIGQGGDMENLYKTKAQEVGVRHVTHFAGTVSEQELPKYYQQCDLLVLPSISGSEAYGIVFLEAFACAKPAIASNLPGVRTVVKDGRFGLLAEPGDAVDVAEKIIAILENPEMSHRFGTVAAEWVRENAVWQKVSEQVKKVYENCSH